MEDHEIQISLESPENHRHKKGKSKTSNKNKQKTNNENHVSENDLILTIDVGTTYIRSIIFNKEAKEIGKSQEPIELIFPQPGWVEQDPERLWQQCKSVMQGAVKNAGCELSSLKAIGLSTQRSSCLTWNKTTGEPVHNILSWQDSRSTQLSHEANHSYTVKGLQMFSSVAHLVTRKERFAAGAAISFSSVQACTRLSYVLKHHEEAKRLAKENNLLFGAIDSWILWKLTGGKVHATDYSNVSATGLWDPFIMSYGLVCSILGIPSSILPTVMDTSGHFGDCVGDAFDVSDDSLHIPITAVCGDQQAALFGQCCFEAGEAKATIGTGCFVNMNTGNQPYSSKNGLYPLVAWKIGDEETFTIEGTDRNAGTAIEWAKEMGMFAHPQDSESIANGVPNSGGVYFVPAFSGLNHPYHDDTARGLMIGLKRDTKREHVVRSILEGIAFRANDLVQAIKDDIPLEMTHLCADGGVCNNGFIMQYLSDVTDLEIDRAEQTEMSSQGVAFLAGLAIGMWKDKEELKKLRVTKTIYKPSGDLSPKQRKKRVKEWKKAVSRSLGWKA